jgi:hypothetical protein
MIPLTARAVKILRTMNQNNINELYDVKYKADLGFYVKPKTPVFKLNKPLPLETIDQPKLIATAYTARKNPYIEVVQPRINSNKKVYVNLSASKARPAGYVMAGTHYNFNKNDLPINVDPITLEQRGNVLRIMQSKKARYRDEGNRQRRDTKARRYKQLLRFVNRTYGRYTEAAEVAFAWNNTSNVSDFVEALAVNEGIDRLYGSRAKLEKKYINQPLRLPVGYRALRSIWRHGTSH